jgi:hypothetical protein
MNQSLIFWPLLVQMLLTMYVFIALANKKFAAAKEGGIDLKRAAYDNNAWPQSVILVSNNLHNQFQAPLIFYVLSFAFFVLQQVDMVVLTIAWVFVVSRIVHFFIHTGSNFVPYRMKIFIVGFLCLLVLMAYLAIKLVSY